MRGANFSFPQVALGKVAQQTKIDSSLVAPPLGYDSVHGVKSSSVKTTDFAEDEFVIYNTTQQYITHLVQFNFKNST